VAAKIVDAGIRSAFAVLTFCDDDIDSSEIEGAFERASDVYDQNVDIDGDLVAHDSNIDGDLVAHDSNIDGDLVAHDANIDGDLVAHDSNIDGDLVAHDSNIDGDLVAHDADIKALLATIQGGVDENRQKLDQLIELLLTAPGRRDGFPLQ
jgi:hypothetical protein